jgi:acetylglutamate kinase
MKALIDQLKPMQIDKNHSGVLAENVESMVGKTVVVKFGGSALIDPERKEALISEVVALAHAGIKLIVVHGGGPAINEALQVIGKKTEKFQGLRITDDETIGVIVEVLSSVNKELAEKFEANGVKALSVCAEQNNIFTTEKLVLQDEEGKPVDLGWVGKIDGVDLFAISRSLDAGYMPVVAPIGMDSDFNLYNLNADHAALAIATAIKAESLVFLTDVPGVLKDVKDLASRFASLSIDAVPAFIKDGTISGGMLPKINSCVAGIEKGVNKISIVDGRQKHALLNGIFAPQEVGTLISGASA